MMEDVNPKAAGHVIFTAGRESAGQGSWTRYGGAQSAWWYRLEDVV
jgi:hypothetical protein